MIKVLLKIFVLLLIIVSSNILAQSNFSFSNKISSSNYFETRELSISVFDNEVLQYQFEKKLSPNQSIPEINILSNSNLVLVYSQEGLVEFYRNKKLLNEYHLYKTHQQNEQVLLSSTTKNELLVLASENNQNIICTFDLDGNFKDSIETKNGIVSGFAASYDSQLIAVSSYNWEAEKVIPSTLILNREINKSILIAEKFEKGIFNNESNLFLGYTNKNSFCIDIENNKILWQDILENNKIYLDAIFEKDISVFIKGETPKFKNNKWVYASVSVFSIDRLGESVKINQVNSEAIGSSFSKKNGKTFLLLDGKSTELNLGEKAN